MAVAPAYLGNVIRIITETGLRIYRELTPMKKGQVDLKNAVVWIPDSKTSNGVAEVPLTTQAVKRSKTRSRSRETDRISFQASSTNAANPMKGHRGDWSVHERLADGSIVEWSDKPNAAEKASVTKIG
jgi:integrase